jgi:uncharacterized protein (DUF2249 family)
VLEAVDTLGADDRLQVLHDRRPHFLYVQLEVRGFAHETEELAPNLIRLTITRDTS